MHWALATVSVDSTGLVPKRLTLKLSLDEALAKVPKSSIPQHVLASFPKRKVKLDCCDGEVKKIGNGKLLIATKN